MSTATDCPSHPRSVGLALALIALTGGGCAAQRVAISGQAPSAWPTATRIESQTIELVAVPAISRIVHLSLRGQPNIFHLNPEWIGQLQDTAMETTGRYRDFGGAKLWNAPQNAWQHGKGGWPPDYVLDSAPSQFREPGPHALTLIGQPSASAGIGYSRTVELTGSSVAHQVVMQDTSDHPTAWGTWSVLCVRPEGVVFLPVPPDAHLWAGDQSTPAAFGWKRHQEVLVLEHPPEKGSKIFCTSSQGWIGYLVDHQALFITYHADTAATYPSAEASSEVYAQGEFIELEHIGPLEQLQPGASAPFSERWHVVPGPPAGLDIDAQAAWMATTAQHLP